MLGESLAMFYSHTAQNRTTIDVATFHFCVRNGNRWNHIANITGLFNCTDVQSKLHRNNS